MTAAMKLKDAYSLEEKLWPIMDSMDSYGPIMDSYGQYIKKQRH